MDEQDGKIRFSRFIIGMGTYMKGEVKDLLRFAFIGITYGTGKKYVTEEIVLKYMDRNMKLLTSAEFQQFMVNRSYLSARSMIMSLGRTVDEDMDLRLKQMVQDKVSLAIYDWSRSTLVLQKQRSRHSPLSSSRREILSVTTFSNVGQELILISRMLCKPSELAAKLLVSALSGVPSDAATVNKTCAKLSKIEVVKD